MLELIKNLLIGLLTGLVNGSNRTKCISLSNQKCMIQPTLINLHPNEYNKKFHYYPFAVKCDRRVGSCNTLNHLSNKVCVLNKTEDLNLSVFNLIIGINESNIVTKDISCRCKCKFEGKNVIQINDGTTINVNVSVKDDMYMEKIIFGIHLQVVVNMANI